MVCCMGNIQYGREYASIVLFYILFTKVYNNKNNSHCKWGESY